MAKLRGINALAKEMGLENKRYNQDCVTVNCSVPLETAKKLLSYANKNSYTRSQVITLALDKFLNGQKP